MDVSTRVELVLKPNASVEPNRIEIPSGVSGQPSFHVPFNQYVAALVCGIDVPITLKFDSFDSRIHDGFPPKAERYVEWLRSLSYATEDVNQPARWLANVDSPRLRKIGDGDNCYGACGY